MKKIKYILAGMAVLLVLFILSSTDWILKEEKETIYSISVIFDEITDESYGNYIAGVNQVLKERMADISYVSLNRPNDEEGQYELLLREVRNGADALIVFPVNKRYLEERLAENTVNIPIYFVGTSSASEKVDGYLCGDSYQRGKIMAESIIEEETAIKAYVFCDMSNMTETEAVFLGLKESFARKDITAVSFRYGGDDFLYEKLQEIRGKKEDAIIIALDAGTLEKIAGWPGYNNRFSIYGIGYSGKVLSYLYDNRIKAINIVNEFGMGYQSLQMVMNSLRQQPGMRNLILESMMIYPENVYDSNYEKQLFPIY